MLERNGLFKLSENARSGCCQMTTLQIAILCFLCGVVIGALLLLALVFFGERGYLAIKGENKQLREFASVKNGVIEELLDIVGIFTGEKKVSVTAGTATEPEHTSVAQASAQAPTPISGGQA
jgi:hypothetical protein